MKKCGKIKELKTSNKQNYKVIIFLKLFSLDFIWYYPKSKTGTSICWELGTQDKLNNFLVALNQFDAIFYLFFIDI